MGRLDANASVKNLILFSNSKALYLRALLPKSRKEKTRSSQCVSVTVSGELLVSDP